MRNLLHFLIYDLVRRSKQYELLTNHDNVESVNVPHGMKHHVHRCGAKEQKDEVLNNINIGSQFDALLLDMFQARQTVRASLQVAGEILVTQDFLSCIIIPSSLGDEQY